MGILEMEGLNWEVAGQGQGPELFLRCLLTTEEDRELRGLCQHCAGLRDALFPGKLNTTTALAWPQ